MKNEFEIAERLKKEIAESEELLLREAAAKRGKTLTQDQMFAAVQQLRAYVNNIVSKASQPAARAQVPTYVTPAYAHARDALVGRDATNPHIQPVTQGGGGYTGQLLRTAVGAPTLDWFTPPLNPLNDAPTYTLGHAGEFTTPTAPTPVGPNDEEDWT